MTILVRNQKIEKRNIENLNFHSENTNWKHQIIQSKNPSKNKSDNTNWNEFWRWTILMVKLKVKNFKNWKSKGVKLKY